MATLWTLSSPSTSPFRGAELSNPFLWPQPSTSFPFSHSVSLCQLLLVPWPLPGFLSSPAQPGVGHSLTSMPFLSFLPLCPPHLPGPRPRWSNHVPNSQPLPHSQGLLKILLSSMAMPEMLLCMPGYFFLPCSTMALQTFTILWHLLPQPQSSQETPSAVQA